MKWIDKVLLFLILGLSILMLDQLICFQNYYHRYSELEHIKKEYEDVNQYIQLYKELKISYSSILGEQDSLEKERDELKKSSSALDYDIKELEDKIYAVNENIKKIS